MRLRSYFGLLLMAIIGSMIIGCGSGETPAGHFTADIVIGEGQRTMTGRFYSQGPRYRMEMNIGEVEAVVIVDEDSEQTYMISPSEKSFRRFKNDTPASRKSNPFQTAKFAALEGTIRNMGIDTIAGLACEKFTISKDGQDVIIQWLAPGLSQPLKIMEAEGTGNHFMNLSNIEIKPVDNSLFDIPADYIEIDQTKSQQPAADSLPAATSFKTQTAVAPVKTPVGRGQELRVSVNPEDKIFIRFKNMLQQGESECMVIFYQNGKEIGSDIVGSVGYRSVVLKKWGVATNNTWDAPADEVALRVLRGMMLLEVRKP